MIHRSYSTATRLTALVTLFAMLSSASYGVLLEVPPPPGTSLA